ncbi:unnamed protein product [Triticum turgidum subsp. durum]|uniref:Uncharacterized protein n=1 Tax=Triticum turgidum subsp. durum TaxID=4567 RepID=A0A9R1AU31_TRITD|nr:unnamed protein product [Triticum turgidum subsp. durum]
MWAWGSFLPRSTSPLLHTRLRPGRRHASQLTAVLGNSNLIGSRGYAGNSDGDSQSRDEAKRQDATGKRHLYVVLDDHEDGFGIHKLDPGEHHELLHDVAHHLPEPPLLWVARTTLGEGVQFAAMGSSIVAIGTDTPISPVLDGRWLADDIGGVLIYDTKTAVTTVAPHLPRGLQYGYKAAMAVGERLYMLDSKPRWDWHKREQNGTGSLHCLTTDPDFEGTAGDEFWDWRALSPSSHWYWSRYHYPPATPFSTEYITAWAAHAQYEMVVSVRPTNTSMMGAIFSFSRRENRWTKRRESHLPVVGQAHYDAHLGAWVGLHAVSVDDGDMYGPLVADGHLCAGNVMSAPEKWTVGKKKLFRFDEETAAGWYHVDAKIVPMPLFWLPVEISRFPMVTAYFRAPR